MSDAAIDVHWDLLVLTPHSGNDLRQRVEGRQSTVELPTAVIRDNDSVDAVVARE